MPSILFEEPFILLPYFLLLSWETSADTFWGWQKKHVGRLLFCLGNSKPFSLRSGLILPHMLGLDIVSFPHSKSLLFLCLIFFFHHKKNNNNNLGEKMQNFVFVLFCFVCLFLIAFQILYVFLRDISVHCALIR